MSWLGCMRFDSTEQMQEFALYKRDREAWARLVAPRRAERLKSLHGEAKRAEWECYGPELRAELRRLAGL